MDAMILYGAYLVFQIFRYCMIISVISSWIPPLYNSKFMSYIHAIVRPYFNWFRFIPPIGIIDVSPIVAFFVYSFVVRYALRGLAFILGVTTF